MSQLTDREGWFTTLRRFPSDFRRDSRLLAADLAALLRRMFRTERAHTAALLIIVLAGIAVRVAMVNRPMMDDESTTYLNFTSRPFSEALSSYGIPNNHLLNTALSRVSILIFGNSPVVLRLPSLIAGCLTILAGYAFARSAYSKEVALLTAALIAAASYMIDYSSVSRGYSFVSTGFMAMLALASLLRANWNTFAAVLLAGVGALSMYAIPIAAYPLAVTFVWLGASLLLEKRGQVVGSIGRDFILSGLLTVVFTALLYLPVILRAGHLSILQMAEPQTWNDFVGYYRYSLPLIGSLWNQDLPDWAVYVLLAAAVIGVIFHWRMTRYAIPVVLVGFVLVPALVIATRTVVPGERIWSFLLPLYLTAAAAGMVFVIDQARRVIPVWALQMTLLALPLLLVLIQSVRVYQHESTYVWDLDPIHRQGAEIAAIIGRDVPPYSAILSMYGAYPAINYYQIVQAGPPGPDYVNWGAIQRIRQTPVRLYVLVVITSGQPEQRPGDIAALFKLNPDDYAEFTLIHTFDRVLLYMADRKSP